jgi:IclR family pca regulon transcriptional regulator
MMESELSPIVDDPKSRRETMGGLAKGLHIIERLSEDAALTVSQAAQRTGVSPASARRCLLTLVDLGYVTHDGRFFRPTPRLRRLGGSYTDSVSLPRLADPFLRAVRDELGESASLAVLNGDHVLFVARAESQRTVTMNVRLGANLPATASATGRVLLAASAPDEVEETLRRADLQRTGPNTLVTVDAIRERIELARSESMSITDEELEDGVRTLAVPVRDSHGRVHAAMSMAVLAARVSVLELRQRHAEVLRREADRLGNSL